MPTTGVVGSYAGTNIGPAGRRSRRRRNGTKRSRTRRRGRSSKAPDF